MKKINKKLVLFLKSPTFYRRLAIAILMILVLVRPTIANEDSERETTNLNIWFVVDASGSMVAKDVNNGNKRRFEQVQDDVSTIVSQIPGAKYGVIVQDYVSYSAVPVTYNADAITAAAPYLQPKDSLYSRPSNFTELLEYAAKRVTQYKERYPERSNVIVFMSDGEDVSGASIKTPSSFQNAANQALVLGYGSENGSIIEEIGGIDENGNSNYLAVSKDQYVKYYGDDSNITVDSENRVISKINQQNLQQIANDMGGVYYHRESGDVPKEAISQLSSAAEISQDSSDETTKTGAEIYWIFAIIVLTLLAWEGEELLTKIIMERSRKNA